MGSDLDALKAEREQLANERAQVERRLNELVSVKMSDKALADFAQTLARRGPIARRQVRVAEQIYSAAEAEANGRRASLIGE